MSIDRELNREDMVCTYHGILLSDKNEWNNVICNSLGGPKDFHSKWSKSEIERQIPHAITYTWNLKYDINKLSYEKETDSQM